MKENTNKKSDFTIGDLRALGIIDLMPNGFTAFYDNAMWEEEDSRFEYWPKAKVWTTIGENVNGEVMSISAEDFEKCIVTSIGSTDVNLMTPAVFITLPKLETSTPTNPMPYNTPFSTNQFDPLCEPIFSPLPSIPQCPPYKQISPGVWVNCMSPSDTENTIPNTPSPQNLNLRINQLETTVGSLAGEYANLNLKHRLEVLENSVKGLLGNSTSFDVRLETVDKRITELENKLDAQVATPVTRSAEEISKAMDCANAYFDNVVQPILCCPHNGYVKYIYNNGYPRIELYGTDLDSLKKYGEAVDVMKKEMKKNIPNFDIDHDFIVEFDDGVIQICKCNLCHSKFKIDRNQVKFNK